MARAFVVSGLTAIQQYVIGPYVVDFAFPGARLVVECDGEYWHSKPRQQSRDRGKDNYLRSHDWRVARLSETAIKHSSDECARQVAILLA